MRFSSKDRSRHIKQMQEGEFDLAIIGGGINGAGVARDAASRGMKVALIEAQDFAEGTSSRSSKLVHGGIRYLENLEFGLVFEALSERRILFDIAPHLVHPLRFVLPLYEGGRVGMFKMGLGMWLYDALSMFEAPEMHERLNPKESVDRISVLKPECLLGSYVYSDAYMDDDRLVIETLRSAHNNGALSANYVKATGATLDSDKVTGVKCEDKLTGDEFVIKAKHTVSTVGPWTDLLAKNLLSSWKPVLRPSKGVHITFHKDRLPLDQAVVMAADEEKRIVFAIPRHEMIIIGTTDTDYSGDPGEVKVESQDVDYLLEVARLYFPGANLQKSDILAAYAGVRPLVDDGSETEGKTSREHTILSDPRNVTFVAGGKYTTYRHMAEESVEAALKNFSLEERVAYSRPDTKKPLNEKCTTDSFLAGEATLSEFSRDFQVSYEDAKFLLERHGGELLEVLAARGKLSAVKKGDPKLRWLLEARFAAKYTMCLNLVDFYFRRAPLFLSIKDHGLSMVKDIASAFSDELGWGQKETERQINATRQKIEFENSWREKS